MPDTQSQLSARQVAELSALADGTLDPRRREEVEGWIASSDALAQMYQEQRFAVSQMRRLRADRAPARLRSHLERETRTRTSQPPRRLRFGMALGLTAAAVIAILAVALPSGTPGAPSVAQAAALAQRGPQHPGPAPDPRDPGARLNRAVQEVYFPNWAHSLGWHAVGERRDRLGGRTAVTVYYAKAGRHLAYTILATPALPQPRVRGRRMNGFVLQTLRAGGREIVTWQRDGHTCVISAAGVPLSVLQTLAAWR